MMIWNRRKMLIITYLYERVSKGQTNNTGSFSSTLITLLEQQLQEPLSLERRLRSLA